jgi:protein transport protein SEC61 subunit alpha
MVPSTGLAYLLSPPRSIEHCLEDPLQALFYTFFALAASAFFAQVICRPRDSIAIAINDIILSQMWVQLSNSGPEAIADQIMRQGLTLRGKRDITKGSRDVAVEKVLSKYISTAAILGGVLIGLITLIADITGIIFIYH